MAASSVWATLFAGTRAAAQHCAPGVEPEPPLTVSFALGAARYRTERYEGHWSEARVGVVGSLAPLSARLSFPAYFLKRNGVNSGGVGDVAVGARATFWGSDEKTYGGGMDLAVTLPTGDPHKGLGMGHPMLMGGPFGILRFGLWAFGAELTLANALEAKHAGGHAAHRKGPEPVVAPMNRSEVEASGLVRWKLSESWSAEATATGALPLQKESGEARLFAGIGPGLTVGPLVLQLRVELPLSGDAFQLRSSIVAGWAFWK